MPGTYTFRPIEANLTHNTDLIGKMNPYCAFLVGNDIVKSQVCKKGGKHPHWTDAITIPVVNDSTIIVELMDQDKFTKDDSIGNFMIDLKEIEARGQVSKWYPLTYKNKPAGEILMEAAFQSDMATGMTQPAAGFVERDMMTATSMTQPTAGFVEKEMMTATSTSTVPAMKEEVIVDQVTSHHHHEGEGKVFIEQKQVVEPHTFTKAVDVVETRPVMKEVEVLEPVKVVKDVQYTEAVPVKKQIEVVEPQVVKKEVEVIEPRLVTKEIQVVENVPVMKEVEVIEPKTIVKEIETFEPQTFTKQVEVTEQVPVKKAVTVTEPVTVTKAVDFVEPVITTQTITKEIQQPVVVDEKITTTVGPATVVGVETEVREHAYVDTRVKTDIKTDVIMTEEERLLAEKKLMGEDVTTYKQEYKQF